MIRNLRELEKFLSDQSANTLLRPRRILMVSPEAFNVSYAINPFMRDKGGNLWDVDVKKASEQWQALKALYEGLGIEVPTMPSLKNCPDMVFTANHGVVFQNEGDSKASVLLGKMFYAERAEEIGGFKSWYESEGYQVYDWPVDVPFEGVGDAVYDWDRGFIWGGYGTRTDPTAYNQIAQITKLPIIDTPIANEMFYHLDTCFSVVDKDTAVVIREAFSKDTYRMFECAYKNLVQVDLEEAKKLLVANCFSPNGKDVVIQKGSRVPASLEKLGYVVHEVETGEFLKSGGSVCCLKMEVY